VCARSGVRCASDVVARRTHAGTRVRLGGTPAGPWSRPDPQPDELRRQRVQGRHPLVARQRSGTPRPGPVPRPRWFRGWRGRGVAGRRSGPARTAAKVVRLRCRAVMNGHARVPGLMATDRCLAERSLCACPGAVPYSSWGCGGACWAELQRGCSGRFPSLMSPAPSSVCQPSRPGRAPLGALCSCGAWFGDGPHRGAC
jgi:hypothetical protein